MTSTDGVEPKERHPFWTVVFWLRRLTIVVLLAWGAGMVLFGDSLTVCGEQLADTGKAVEVCEALTLTDPPVLLYLLVLLVLLLPEAAEVEVAGLFRIKRQLEEAKEDVAGLRQSVSALQSQIASAAATSRSSAQNTTTVIVDRAAETGGVAAGEAPSVGESGDVGVGPAAVLAFKAAFEGLTTLLPASFPAAELVGFTLQADGAPVASHFSADLDDTVIERAADLAERSGSRMALDIADGFGFMSAAAKDDDGTQVGILVMVIVQEPGEPASQVLDRLGAHVAVLASVYARLLVDLLGETGLASSGVETA